MFPIRLLRLLAIASILIPLHLPCFGDEKGTEPPSMTSARRSIQPYVDWLPSRSETLVVLQRPYEIPPDPGEETSLRSLSLRPVFYEVYLRHMFEGDARDSLIGKTIKLWIEGSTRFRFPVFPDEVEYVQSVGVPFHYDGSHIMVFDASTPPDTKELFARLMQQHPEPTALNPPAEKHMIEGHEAIAYSASPPDRMESPRETHEDRLLIAATLSVRYWIASPEENVLIVATSREVLAETLRKVKNPDQTAFPASLEEWKHITGDMPIWGLRHFPAEIDPTDTTDLAEAADAGHISGLTFEIDAHVDKAELTFLNSSPGKIRALQDSIPKYIYSMATFTMGPRGRLVAHLDWSQETSDDDLKVERNLVYRLLSKLGHAVVI